ncbi:MAG: transpeptidase family protein [Bacteroidetes bacterium]|jgi:cell division protein FtsI (penicillin-binding protein 3)|nr:transpeptidase family protein [Bacteroidota bacterium]HMT77279.1 penicillin-binding protein [Saprospiraceae bacterium]
MKPSVDNKSELLRNANIVMLVFSALALIIIGQVVRIAVVKGDHYRELGKELRVKAIDIEADRGKIIGDNGELLATSMPFYDVYFDPMASSQYVKEMKEKDSRFMKREGDIFAKNIDSLSWYISKVLMLNLSPNEVKQWIISKRKQKERYLCLAKGISYNKMKQVENFPLFRMGRGKSGIIFDMKYKRVRPYGDLALRTIGYNRDNSQSIGLESAYDSELRGEVGKRMVQFVSKTKYVPINDLTEIEPRNGNDVMTTINVQIQDVAQEALQKALEYHDADYGTAIVMEVKTGAVKAITNLKKEGDLYSEAYNYGVGLSVEPGSTFKLASVMAILESGKMSLEKEIDVNFGKAVICGREMKDSETHGHDKLTLRQSFELSSNIGISKAVVDVFGQSRTGVFQFVDYVKQFHLDKMTGIDIPGEAKPLIKTPYNLKQLWSRTSLPWMAHGYETQLTPLQMLTFYNAVANNGKMMRPRLVSGIWSHGTQVKNFPPEVLVESIAKPSTIRQARGLLEGVVINGTAKKYKTELYSFAGKTGTASLDYGGVKRGRYRASFIGYFPADDPIYSVCVMITEPKVHGYHGAEVALPVFKSIADKILSFDPKFFKVYSPDNSVTAFSNLLPSGEKGIGSDYLSVFNRLGVPVYLKGKTNDFVITDRGESEVRLLPISQPANKVPDVKGMGLKDAVYALETYGLKVEVEGYGRVAQQDIPPGADVTGQTVMIKLK